MDQLNYTTFYVVRHGETAWNLIGKQQGHLDSPLTTEGVRQSKALARGLTEKGIAFIYSSSLGRAVKTAELIGSHLHLPVQVDTRLCERNLGVLQGMTRDEFKLRYPDPNISLNSSDPDYFLPEGESLRQVYERSVDCLEEFALRHSGQKILIVTHGGILRCLFFKAVCLPLSSPRKFSLFNAAINRFTITGSEWRLDTWGDISHMGGMATLDDF